MAEPAPLAPAPPAEQIALDVHAHLVPAHETALGAFAGVSWTPARESLVIDGHRLGITALFSPQALIDWMDENRVARAWVSVPPPTYRPALPETEARAWAAALNAGLAVICARFPARLAPLFHLVVEHPAVASETAASWIARGHRRFAMSAGGAQIVLSDTAFEPLWQALNAASGFLFLHPGEGCDPRLDPFYLQNLLGNPTETAIAASHLLLSGVLERHSRLKLCLAHAGGTTAAIAGRLERGFRTSRPGLDTALTSPRQLLKRICVDCIAHDPQALALAVEVHGAGNVVFGSDWPFPMGLPKPHEQLAVVEPGLRRRIFADNPLRLTDGS